MSFAASERGRHAVMFLLGSLFLVDGEGESWGIGGENSNSPVAAPAADEGERCTDVGNMRVCWVGEMDGADVHRGIRPQVRPLPRGATRPSAWRCVGVGRERTCSRLQGQVGPWSCTAHRCVQSFPRMPDDGEWECADGSGASICRRVAKAAGAVEGPPDAGWFCGPLSKGPTGEASRICVDFAPDWPWGAPSDWSCRYDHGRRGERRVCEQRAHHGLTSPCDPGTCDEGLLCVEHRCWPQKPNPTCWLDTDCKDGQRCQWGTCSRSAP